MELEELRRLLALKPREELVKEPIPAVPEWKILANELVKMSKVRVAEREVELPGMTKWKDVILQAVQAFWEKKGKPLVMPHYIAKNDDLTVGSLRPEVFGEDNYKQTGLSVGTYEIIPKGTGTYSVKDDEVIVITDLIEAQAGQGNVTAAQCSVDGVLYRPLEFRIPSRATDLHLVELPFPAIADSSLDLDGKVEFAGDAEITPMGVQIALGKVLPTLT